MRPDPGDAYLSFYDYEDVADGSTSGHSDGNSSYSGPGGSSSTSYVSDWTGNAHDEWHTTTLSGTSGTPGSPEYVWGSVSDRSEVHSSSSGSTWTQTSTVNGASSTTSGSYSSSSSTPRSSHTETGTVPGGPPESPTYSGPDDADFDTLLTALATAAAGAYSSPSSLGSAIRSAVTAFLVLDVDENASDGGDTDITQYTWDNGNRLVQVTDRAVFGGDAVQIVTYLYDAENRWIGETVDSDADGTVDYQTYFAYDGNQIVLEFDKEGTRDVTGEDLSHRYLWGPAVDLAPRSERPRSVSGQGQAWSFAQSFGRGHGLRRKSAYIPNTGSGLVRLYGSNCRGVARQRTHADFPRRAAARFASENLPFHPRSSSPEQGAKTPVPKTQNAAQKVAAPHGKSDKNRPRGVCR